MLITETYSLSIYIFKNKYLILKLEVKEFVIIIQSRLTRIYNSIDYCDN